MLNYVFAGVASCLVFAGGVQFDSGFHQVQSEFLASTFSDLNLPSPSAFADSVESQYKPKIVEFLGYAVPTVAAALFIRSSLNR